MKKILGMAVVAALAAGASVFAANPFSDVSTSDWAYQAVADLSGQGIVEGYPDGTFKGQSNITRYEMAQIVARLMAKEDQYNAEQRATIDKLAGEYADELDRLGVRVGNLEKKVGNISWSGDSRLRFRDHGDRKDDDYKARLRINVKGQVNDQVTVIGRFLSEADLKGGDSADTSMDRLHVLYKPSDDFSLDLGRTDLFLGQTGYLYDDRFDGVIAKYNADKFGLEVGYGREWKTAGNRFDYAVGNGSQAETFYVQANGDVGDKVHLNAFYQNFAKGENPYTEDNMSLWGVGAKIALGSGFYIDGDYIQNTASGKVGSYNKKSEQYEDKGGSIDKPSMWVAGLNYSNFDGKKPGTYYLGLHYTNVEKGAYVGSTTLDMDDMLSDSWDNGAKFWNAKASVALMKGVSLDLYYFFAGEDKDGKDLDDTYGAALQYKF